MAAGLASSLLALGCDAGVIGRPSATFYGGADGGSSDDAVPASIEDSGRALFETQVRILLEGRCISCHGEAGTAPQFLVPASGLYESVLAWPGLVDRRTPVDSALLTKGGHAGPAWTGPEARIVLGWLELEADGAPKPDDGPMRTMGVVPTDGFHAIDLGPLGLDGTSISFIASRDGESVTLTEIRVSTGPDGAALDRPTLVRLAPGLLTPEDVERLAELEVRIPPGTSLPVGDGTLALETWAEADEVAFRFEAVGPYEADPDGCANVPAFTRHAAPLLTGDCVGCHAGEDAEARAAMDLGGLVEASPAGVEASCAATLGAVDPADPAESALLRAPDPARASGHPFTYATPTAYDGFRTAMLLWLAAE